MIELKQNRLVFSFPEIHPQAHCTIEFQRTLRLPDDNREYPLPPGLGQFPLLHVDDLGERLPIAWGKRGGVFFPMYQAESMWIKFNADYPFAIKVAAGKINAVTGDAWSNTLQTAPQDYLIIPGQSWLDGFCVAKGSIRQFVAMPLGSGYTAEEQLTGTAQHGGLQVIAYPMKLEFYEALMKNMPLFSRRASAPKERYFETRDIGLAPGGLMRQEIYKDHHGFPAWDTTVSSRCFVHIVNSKVYRSLTNSHPPTRTPTATDYTDAGLPWFEYFNENAATVSGAQTLAGLDSVAATSIKKEETPLPENEPVKPANIKRLGGNEVREGEF